VARRAGYNNVQYMTMVFRRQIDDTPASVRRKARQ
jgi:AraC-like DNA-binding protein